MWVEVGLGIILGVLLGAVIGLALTRADLRRQLVVERQLVADLHSRLAARSYGEYAAFQPPTHGPLDEPSRTLRDDTGLIEATLTD